MVTASERVAAIMGRQLLSIAQLEAEVEILKERNAQLSGALKEVSEELASEKAAQIKDSKNG